MPIYNMQCKVCGNAFGRECHIDERNDQRCPRCGEIVSVRVACLGSTEEMIFNPLKKTRSKPHERILRQGFMY
jgi:putative FmdB family regulatory protein